MDNLCCAAVADVSKLSCSQLLFVFAASRRTVKKLGSTKQGKPVANCAVGTCVLVLKRFGIYDNNLLSYTPLSSSSFFPSFISLLNPSFMSSSSSPDLVLALDLFVTQDLVLAWDLILAWDLDLVRIYF